MRAFDFDPDQYAADYERQGWVRIPKGVSEEFHRLAVSYADQHLGDLSKYAIAGKKQQGVFEAIDEVDVDHILDVVATVTGLQRATLVFSERHLQVYDESADPRPEAHKDRYSSQVSVGLTVAAPAATQLALWPDGDRAVNRNDKATYHRPTEEPPILFHDDPRDVVMFGGHSTWHARYDAAGTINLYFKFNDFEYDPLAEDPRRLETAGSAPKPV